MNKLLKKTAHNLREILINLFGLGHASAVQKVQSALITDTE